MTMRIGEGAWFMEDKMKIRKKLQSENCFNPFNEGYEWKKLKGYLDSEKIESTDDGYSKVHTIK